MHRMSSSVAIRHLITPPPPLHTLPVVRPRAVLVKKLNCFEFAGHGGCPSIEWTPGPNPQGHWGYKWIRSCGRKFGIL